MTAPLHSLAPMLIGLEVEVAQLAAGKDHHCVLDTDGRVWCWGENGIGESAPANVGRRRYWPVEVVIP